MEHDLGYNNNHNASIIPIEEVMQQLFQAIDESNTEMFRKILSDNRFRTREILYCKNFEKILKIRKTFLHAAAIKGDLEIFNIIIETAKRLYGNDKESLLEFIDFGSNHKETALFYSARTLVKKKPRNEENYIKIINTLIELGAKQNLVVYPGGLKKKSHTNLQDLLDTISKEYHNLNEISVQDQNVMETVTSTTSTIPNNSDTKSSNTETTSIIAAEKNIIGLDEYNHISNNREKEIAVTEDIKNNKRSDIYTLLNPVSEDDRKRRRVFAEQQQIQTDSNKSSFVEIEQKRKLSNDKNNLHNLISPSYS